MNAVRHLILVERNLSIGHAEIYLLEGSANIGRILIGDKELRGKGLGQKITTLLVEYIFTNLNRSVVELNVFDWNIAAIKCYEKAGFKKNADKKLERKVNGQTWIAINMWMEKEKYNTLLTNGYE